MGDFRFKYENIIAPIEQGKLYSSSICSGFVWSLRDMVVYLSHGVLAKK